MKKASSRSSCTITGIFARKTITGKEPDFVRWKIPDGYPFKF